MHLKTNGDWKGGALAPKSPPLNPPLAVVSELHSDHPGIVRMKEVARSYVWWEGIDKDIETVVKSCKPCQAVRNAPPIAPLHPWLWPTKPW